MNIGIIGAGNIGSALAKHLCRLGHRVRVANSRGPETLVELAKQTGAIPVPLHEAASGVDLLVVTIPMKSVLSFPKDLLTTIPPTAPIIDTGNYYPLRDGRIADIDDGMIESEWTSKMLGRPVIKAFNNIVADSLLHKAMPKGSKHRIALPVSGADPQQKQIVMQLIDDIGFDAIDVGPLSASWRYQPGTPAYCSDPTIDQLQKLLKRAGRDKAPKSRYKAAKIMANLPPNFPPQDLVRVARLSAGMDLLQPRSWVALIRFVSAAL